MQRKLLFIVNPRSGKKNSEQIISIINCNIPKNIIFEIGLWTNLNEFNVLAKKLIDESFTEAIAVGGDGSVNLVANTILKTELTLGIIPTGSGNGLARSLGISVKPQIALEQIIEGKFKLIDSGEVNGHPFFCTSGVGFDAHIAKLFADLKKRGLKNYIKLIFKEYFIYQAKEYDISYDGQTINEKAFFITVANAGQFGNNFYIAPNAKLNDGLFNVVIVRPLNFFSGLGLIFKVIKGKVGNSKHINCFTCTQLNIKSKSEGVAHLDGEPLNFNSELNYKLIPQNLKVIVGVEFDGI